MVSHGLSGQGYAGHEAESVDEILALKGAVQLAMLDAPALEFRQFGGDFQLG
jgi:hypothetical protein